MKAAFLKDLKKFTIEEIPDPVLENDTDVLIRVGATGVCGSDVHYYERGRIGDQVVEFPFIIGHEFAGIVEKKPGRKYKRFKPETKWRLIRPFHAGSVSNAGKADRIHVITSGS